MIEREVTRKRSTGQKGWVKRENTKTSTQGGGARLIPKKPCEEKILQKKQQEANNKKGKDIVPPGP